MPGVENEGPKYEGELTCPAAMEGGIVARGILIKGGRERRNFKKGTTPHVNIPSFVYFHFPARALRRSAFRAWDPMALTFAFPSKPLTLDNIHLFVPASIQTPPHGERDTSARQNTNPWGTSASNSNVDQLAQGHACQNFLDIN